MGAAGSHMDGVARREGRVPLKEMVEECAQRWFQDALKEAKAGDSAMQVLVAQMYQSGYGVPKNEQKEKIVADGRRKLIHPLEFFKYKYLALEEQ